MNSKAECMHRAPVFIVGRINYELIIGTDPEIIPAQTKRISLHIGTSRNFHRNENKEFHSLISFSSGGKGFSLNLYTPLKTMGKMNSVRVVAVISPPITTIARGLEVSDPIPVEVAAGISPMAAIRAAIATGLILDMTPERIAISRGIRSARFFLNLVRRITLFWKLAAGFQSLPAS
jgi:hypothetical protein